MQMRAMSVGRAWVGLVFLTASTLLGGALVGCSGFRSQRPSTVAEGKYYSSGHPQYDEFFIGLYALQVQMNEAPAAPAATLRGLAQSVGLRAPATLAQVVKVLRERALQARERGVYLRFDQDHGHGEADPARAVVRSNPQPTDQATLVMITQVESSADALLRSMAEMTAGEASLTVLERKTIALDAGVNRAFAQAPPAKQGEVKSNLADAHRLITLMRARAGDVRAGSQQMLAGLSKALDTDDGSVPQVATEATTPPALDRAENTKHFGAKGPTRHAKPGRASPPADERVAPSRQALVPRPQPVKAVAAAREFEP